LRASASTCWARGVKLFIGSWDMVDLRCGGVDQLGPVPARET
jgi:hypothetical protein